MAAELGASILGVVQVLLLAGDDDRPNGTGLVAAFAVATALGALVSLAAASWAASAAVAVAIVVASTVVIAVLVIGVAHVGVRVAVTTIASTVGCVASPLGEHVWVAAGEPHLPAVLFPVLPPDWVQPDEHLLEVLPGGATTRALTRVEDVLAHGALGAAAVVAVVAEAPTDWAPDPHDHPLERVEPLPDILAPLAPDLVCVAALEALQVCGIRLEVWSKVGALVSIIAPALEVCLELLDGLPERAVCVGVACDPNPVVDAALEVSSSPSGDGGIRIWLPAVPRALDRGRVAEWPVAPVGECPPVAPEGFPEMAHAVQLEPPLDQYQGRALIPQPS